MHVGEAVAVVVAVVLPVGATHLTASQELRRLTMLLDSEAYTDAGSAANDSNMKEFVRVDMLAVVLTVVVVVDGVAEHPSV